MPSSTDLAGLLAAVASGDRAAFERLYGLTAPKLLGIVLRIVKDRGAAEDVVQDAFLRVWRSAASFDPAAGQPMAWMVAIARNRAIDTVRRRREALAGELDDGVRDWLETVAGQRDPEGDFVGLDQLRLCLERLDERQRRCLLEAYYEGYSREELADRFGAPVNTIKTWLHRSSQALRSCLEER